MVEDKATKTTATKDTATKDTAKKDTATKETATKDTATKGTATQGTATKGTATKEIAKKKTVKESNSNEPKDEKHILYIIMVIQGIGTLTAWNMLITAKDYFVQHKLANQPGYANNFLAHLGISCQIPNLCFNWLNVFVEIGGNLTVRILFSLAMEVLLFVFTIILAMVDTSSWTGTFFWLTMIIAFFLNALNAIYQNSLYGVCACLPPRYMGAAVLGSNICGTLVALLSWLTRNIKNVRAAAIYYFIGGMAVLMACFSIYYALPLLKIFRHYMSKHPHTATTSNVKEKRHVPYGLIFKQAWVQFYNIFVTFFVTLAVFPAVISDIQPVKPGFLGNNFVLITCFFTFNFMATIGNITANLYQYPRPRYLMILTTVRLLFIPFFLMCNYQPPGRKKAVLVKSDWLFWFFCALLSWTSGHASSLGLMYAPGTVAAENAMKTGMLGAAMVMSGIMTGVLFTRLCPYMVL